MNLPGCQQYKLTQCFGDKMLTDQEAEEDIITSIKFDKTGNYLSVGDRAGRLIVFDIHSSKNKRSSEYSYHSQLQSHNREFDFLRCIEIDEKINDIDWLNPQGSSLYVLTTNSRTIKLWKMAHRTVKEVKKSAGKELSMPTLHVIEEGLVPKQKILFPRLHNSPINALSHSANEQYALSSDDLKVFLWNLEVPNKAYVPIQIKPQDPDDPTETITSSLFHPSSDSLFAYCTNKGGLRMADMRISAVCDNTAVSFLHETNTSKSFLTQLVSSYASLNFTANEKFLAVRDFMNVKVWDIAMPGRPLSVIPINEGMKSKLCEMYENQEIFQKFSLSSSPDSRHFVTGDFNSSFHILDAQGTNYSYELDLNRKTIIKQMAAKMDPLGSIKYSHKTLKSTFHPLTNTVAVACLNCFFVYSV